MTMYSWDNVECRNCGTTNKITELCSTNAFGSSDLDLRPPEMQRSTMDTWLQLCSHCGYVAADITEPPADPTILESEPYLTALLRTDYPELARRFLAHAVTLEQIDPANAGQAYLESAWVCDDAGHSEQALESRTKAANCFNQCRPFADDATGVGLGTVLVDILRRSKQFDEASKLCTMLLDYESSNDVIQEVLKYQQQLIAQQDVDAHMISDCEMVEES